MRDPHYGRRCFKSVKALVSTFLAVEKAEAKNEEFFGLSPIRILMLHYNMPSACMSMTLRDYNEV